MQTDREKEEDEFDWSQPVSSQVGGLLDDEPDWLEQEEESDKQNEEAGMRKDSMPCKPPLLLFSQSLFILLLNASFFILFV